MVVTRVDTTKRPVPVHQKRHYEHTAAVLKLVLSHFSGNAEVATLAVLASAFATSYHVDNAAFDVERFHKACGFG